MARGRHRGGGKVGGIKVMHIVIIGVALVAGHFVYTKFIKKGGAGPAILPPMMPAAPKASFATRMY